MHWRLWQLQLNRLVVSSTFQQLKPHFRLCPTPYSKCCCSATSKNTETRNGNTRKTNFGLTVAICWKWTLGYTHNRNNVNCLFWVGRIRKFPHCLWKGVDTVSRAKVKTASGLSAAIWGLATATLGMSVIRHRNILNCSCFESGYFPGFYAWGCKREHGGTD
jgi:hypothetical protein